MATTRTTVGVLPKILQMPTVNKQAPATPLHARSVLDHMAFLHKIFPALAAVTASAANMSTMAPKGGTHNCLFNKLCNRDMAKVAKAATTAVNKPSR
eukprot:Skav201106  [mRNA]  locus=scaffold497:165329:165941:+ [translate_table: standard]